MNSWYIVKLTINKSYHVSRVYLDSYKQVKLIYKLSVQLTVSIL